MHLLYSIAIQPNLELKTLPILGSLPLDIALPGLNISGTNSGFFRSNVGDKGKSF